MRDWQNVAPRGRRTLGEKQLEQVGKLPRVLVVVGH